MLNKLLCISIIIPLFLSFATWGTDFEKARQQSLAEHKPILLNFSGSDWCGPCIKMHHDFFDNAAFTNMAEKNIVLVNADFPRQKKNQLSKSQQDQNNRLADKYNPTGSFPLTVLLDENGNVLQRWDGYPKISVDEFIATIKKSCNVSH